MASTLPAGPARAPAPGFRDSPALKPAATSRRRAVCRRRAKRQVDAWLETRLPRGSSPWPPRPADESILGRNGREDGLVGDQLDFVTRDAREEIPPPPWLEDFMLRVDKRDAVSAAAAIRAEGLQ